MNGICSNCEKYTHLVLACGYCYATQYCSKRCGRAHWENKHGIQCSHIAGKIELSYRPFVTVKPEPEDNSLNQIFAEFDEKNPGPMDDRNDATTKDSITNILSATPIKLEQNIDTLWDHYTNPVHNEYADKVAAHIMEYAKTHAMTIGSFAQITEPELMDVIPGSVVYADEKAMMEKGVEYFTVTKKKGNWEYKVLDYRAADTIGLCDIPQTPNDNSILVNIVPEYYTEEFTKRVVQRALFQSWFPGVVGGVPHML
jgi:hypothetical protein